MGRRKLEKKLDTIVNEMLDKINSHYGFVYDDDKIIADVKLMQESPYNFSEPRYTIKFYSNELFNTTHYFYAETHDINNLKFIINILKQRKEYIIKRVIETYDDYNKRFNNG